MRHAVRITNTAGAVPASLNVIAVPMSRRVNL
jgi:hypothetical protein